MQRLCGTHLRTFVAEDALRSIFSVAGFFVDLHVHGTDPQTFATVDTFTLVTMDPQQGEIAHGLEEHRDGAEILAERAIILEGECQHDASDVVKHISSEKQPEHDFFQMCGLHQKQPGHQCQRQSKHYIAQNAQLFFPRFLRLFIRQKIQQHRRPAGVAAPAAPEQQRSKDFCNRIVDRRRLKYAEEQGVPEPFDLHILAGDDAEIQQHIVSHRQLYEMAGISFPGGKERCSYPKADSDVAEIQQIEQVAFCEP